jgi:hypothetical protein
MGRLEMKFVEKKFWNPDCVNRVRSAATAMVWPCRKMGQNKDTEKRQ